jgi:predicted O-methyltransferase YrrM
MALKHLFANPLTYAKARGRLALDLALSLPRIRKMRRAERSWDELIDFVFKFGDGFLEPLQVRSEIRGAMEAIEKRKPRRVLEIGTAHGGTFFLLSRAAHPDATLISVDLPGGKWGGGYSAWKTGIFRRMLLPGQSAHFIRANSQDPSSKELVKAMLGKALLDVLFIDGDHSYEGVSHDFLLYRDLVRRGGLIVFHDVAIHAPEKQCEVARLWAELKQRYPATEIIEHPDQGWAGIGILRNEPLSVRVAAEEPLLANHAAR